jgi:hypothetical protein
MKSGKQFTILSDNPKMDTSGMAGKPRPMPTFEWKPPVMTIKDIMEVHEMKGNKRPETESS